MIDDVSDIRDFYATQVEKEDSRLQHHQLERDITRRYLEQYLPAKGNILEIGAATGAYTLWLAEKGYHITAVDLTTELLEFNRQRLQAANLLDHVSYHIADARDLSVLQSESFDAALLMGPMYHLIEAEDRNTALRQVLGKLKPGACFFSSWISRIGIFGDLMKNVPQWIEDQNAVRYLLEKGADPANYHKGGFRGYFAATDEVISTHEAQGFETILLAGVEPSISAEDESYNCLEGNQRQLWQDLLFELSRDPRLLASSRHLLYIGRRPLSS